MKKLIYLTVLVLTMFTTIPSYSEYYGHSVSGILMDVDNLKIGMTRNELLTLEGHPYEINRTVSSSGVWEQWIYTYKYTEDIVYVYFKNNILLSWSI